MSEDEIDALLARIREAAGLELPNVGGLPAWRSALEKQADMFEGLANHFKTRSAELREKIRAVDTLLGKPAPTPDPVGSSEVGGSRRIPTPETGAGFTPVEAYWHPILETLIELGGRGSREQVIERVGEKLDSTLTAADWEILPSGLDVRWKNRVAWQRLNMVKRGFLRADSPRGIWEITEGGRNWVAQRNIQVSMLEFQTELTALCKKSDPNCEVRIIRSDVAGHFRLRVASGGIALIASELDINLNDFVTKTTEQRWDFLESISARRIRRPVA
jgi:hypothetical protein